MAKLAGYHSEVEYASPEWEWAMVEEPGTQTSRKRAHEQLKAELDEVGSDESEGEITDLQFKNVGQVTRFLDKRQRQIQQTMDRIEKAFPGNSVSRVQNAGLSYLTKTHSWQALRVGRRRTSRTSRRAASIVGAGTSDRRH